LPEHPHASLGGAHGDGLAGPERGQVLRMEVIASSVGRCVEAGGELVQAGTGVELGEREGDPVLLMDTCRQLHGEEGMSAEAEEVGIGIPDLDAQEL